MESLPAFPPSPGFQHTPVVVLSSVFEMLTPKQRVGVSRTCKQWKELIEGNQSFWREVLISETESVSSAIKILFAFSKNSNHTLNSVIINCKIPEKKLDKVFRILKQSWRYLFLLHITQEPHLNLKTRTFARTELDWLEIYSTAENPYAAPVYVGKKSARGAEVFVDGSSLPPTLTWVYVDDFKALESEDIEWIERLKHFRVASTNTLLGLQVLLSSINSSLKSLDLSSYEVKTGDFTMLEGTEDVEFSALSDLKMPVLQHPVFPDNWKFPSLTKITADVSTLLEIDKELFKGITCLTLLITAWQEEDVETGSDDGSDDGLLDIYEVTDVMVLCPELKCLEFRFLADPEEVWEIDTLFFYIKTSECIHLSETGRNEVFQ